MRRVVRSGTVILFILMLVLVMTTPNAQPNKPMCNSGEQCGGPGGGEEICGDTVDDFICNSVCVGLQNACCTACYDDGLQYCQPCVKA